MDDYLKDRLTPIRFCVHCHLCDEKFNVDFKNLKSKPSLHCPNCHQEFNKEAIKHLNSALDSIEKALKVLYVEKFEHHLFENHDSFSISIQWTQSNELPYSSDESPTTFL